MRRTLISGLLFCCAAEAQFSVDGDVVLRTTGQPLAGVRVLAMCDPALLAPAQLTATDPNGHFQFAALPAPGCYLQVDGPGLMKRGTIAGTPADGSHATVRVQVWPQGLIAGKVLDANGWPVRAHLLLSRHADADGLPAETIDTNDLGEYRFGKLAPGRYYIYVARASGLFQADLFVPGWYRSGSGDEATPIDVKVGQQVTNADIHLSPGGGVELSGRIAMPEGFSPSRAVVQVRSMALGSSQGASRVAVVADGSFKIPHVAPGTYWFTVTTSNSVDNRTAPPYLATQTVKVGHQNIGGIALNVTATPVRDIAGTVVFQGGRADQVHVRLTHMLASGGNSAIKAGSDGSFVAPAQWPGRMMLQVFANDGQPVSADFGGQAITDRCPSGGITWCGEFDFDGAALPLRVNVTRMGSVPVTVADATGKPVDSAEVAFLAPGEAYDPGPPMPTRLAFSRANAPNNARLLPGAYRVYVIPEYQDANFLMADPAFLQAQEKAHAPIQVVGGDNPPLILTLSPK